MLRAADAAQTIKVHQDFFVEKLGGSTSLYGNSNASSKRHRQLSKKRERERGVGMLISKCTAVHNAVWSRLYL